MQLISIETTNFKKLRRFQANFRQGLNVIVGDNAQGKSTLLQAIEAALYGATVVPGKKDKIPTWGQSTWKIELTFVAKDDRYRLTRSKTTAKLERVSDGESSSDTLVANGNTPVTAAVAELLDLDAKDYNLFMQSKQGETTGVLTFGAAALNRKVEEFAGISLIDRVQSLAQEEYRTKRVEADALAVSGDVMEESNQQVMALGDAALDAEKALKDAQEAFEGLPATESLAKPDADPDAMQARLTLIDKLRGRLERAEQEVKHAEQRHQEALQRLEEMEAPAATAELEQRVSELAAKVKPAVAEVDRLQKELSLQEHLWVDYTEAQSLLNGLPDQDDIGNALSHEVEQQAARHDERRAENERVVELNQQIKQRKSLAKDASCPTCGTKLSEHDPEKLAAEIAELTEQRDAHQRAWEELTRTCRAIDEQVKQLEDGFEKRRVAEARVDELRETLAGKGVDLATAETPVEGELEAAKEVHQGLLVEKADAEHRLEQRQWRQYLRAEKAVGTENASLDEFIDELQSVSHELDDRLIEGEPTEEEIKQARWAVSEYEREVSVLRSRRLEAQHAVDLAEQAFKQAEDRLAQAKGTVEQLAGQNERSLAAAKAADAAGRLARFLRDRRAGYLQEVWDAVLGAASKQVAMASKGMIARIVFDDGDFLYEEDGVLAPVTSASGAQKAHIGVAIRIGLARALYGSDALLIFDEPTESMSEHHASGLSASLAGAAAQCLLITHRDQDQDLAAHVIEVAA